MNTTQAPTKRKRAKKGYGRLYIRTSKGKEYKAGTQGTGGFYWLEYLKPTGTNDAAGKPLKKKARVKLLTESGEPITNKAEAEKAQEKIISQYVTATKKEQLNQLKAELEEATQEHAEAEDEANPPTTLAEAWETYLNSNDAPETGIDTLKYYAGYWKKLCEWIEREHPETKYVRDITTQTAQGYVSHLRKADITPNTFNKHIGFLKLFFRVLEEPARTTENPFEKVKKRKLQTNVRRELSMKELKDVLEKADGELQTLLYLGTFTGLRLGDCCTLKWGEVDLVRMQIKRIPNKLQHRDNAKPVVVGIPSALHYKLSETPSSKRKGYVISAFAGMYIYRNNKGRPSKQPDITKQIQKHFKDACGIQIHKEGTGYIKVPDPTGKHAYLWEHTGKRAVVEVGFHSLRHTYVSIQAQQGTPQAVVQAIVGHGNPAMTAHYTHIGEQAAQQAALAMPSNIVDADFEVISAPLPEWARKLAEQLNAENWETVRRKLLEA